MKKIWVFLITVSVLVPLGVTTALAQTKAGTSAAPELLIPVGAKDVATAGSAISSTTGVDAIFWNPAGLDASTDNTTALFSYRSYIADISISYLAVAAKTGFGSLGLTLRSYNIGEIGVTTEDLPDGNGQIIKPTYFTLGATYSKQVTDRVGIGITANIISENFGQVSASGIAFDAGVQYKDLAEIKGLSLGVSVKNIGTSLQYGGPGLWVQATDANADRSTTYYKIEAATFQLPTTIQIGAGYKLPVNEEASVQLNGTFENDNYGLDQYRIGAEFEYLNSLFLRAGYTYSSHNGVTSIFQNYAVGAGLNLARFAGVNLEFNYAYVPVKYFDANNLIDIRFNF